MKHNLWYRIVRWLITHSTAGMTYVIEMRNEVAEFYERRIETLKIGELEKLTNMPVIAVGKFSMPIEMTEVKADDE